MKRNAAYLKVALERDIPISELKAVALDIWDRPPEEQDAIREAKAVECAEKYPLKTEGQQKEEE